MRVKPKASSAEALKGSRWKHASTALLACSRGPGAIVGMSEQERWSAVVQEGGPQRIIQVCAIHKILKMRVTMMMLQVQVLGFQQV